MTQENGTPEGKSFFLSANEKKNVQFISFPETHLIIAKLGVADPDQSFMTAEKIKYELREAGATPTSVKTNEGIFVAAPDTEEAILSNAGFTIEKSSSAHQVYARYHDAFQAIEERRNRTLPSVSI